MRTILPPQKEFTREVFRAWLSEQNPERRFVYQDTKNCVFASFLKEKLEMPFPNVGPEDYDSCVDEGRSNYTETYALPDWALRLSIEMAREGILSVAKVLELDASI